MNKNDNNFYGLVLVGGKSKRMGKDKALLKYGNSTQIEKCFIMLKTYCEKTFISTREDQRNNDIYKDFPQIIDQHNNIGPLDGILTALKTFPNKPWIVIACDLPLMDNEVINTLIRKRDPLKIATVFKSTTDELPEPLCGIYEPKAIIELSRSFNNKIYCPRKILINTDIKLIDQEQNKLFNINSELELNKFKIN